MQEPISFYADRYIPTREIAISPHDIGFLMGATVAERARTFRGQLFRWPEHLARLRRSLEITGINIPYDGSTLTQHAEHVVAANRRELEPADDLALCLFVSPGNSLVPAPQRSPTVCIYTERLAHASFARLYEDGQALIVPDIRQTSPANWPLELKCRSRMHYYLADAEAQRAEPGARAVLLDVDGRLTEASTANIVAWFANEGLVSPPLERVLPGISLIFLSELATRLNMRWTYRDMTTDDLAAADEVLLCSTSPCLVPAVRLNGHSIGQGRPGPIFRRLMHAWSEHVGLDIIEQSRRLA